MTFKTFKSLALAGIAAMALTTPYEASNAAANTATVPIAMVVESGITATNVSNIDFGNYLIGVHTAETPTLIMTPAGVVSTAGATLSRLVHLDAVAPVAGSVRVTLPAGANGVILQMQRTAPSAFTGSTELTLSAITYSNSDNGTQNGTLPVTTNVPITVTTGATGALVSFGGTITASATPATDGAHVSTFNIAFAY